MHTRAWRAHKPCPRSITETVLRAFLPLSLFFSPFFSFHVRRLLRGLRFTSLVCTCTQLIALSRLLSVYHCSNIFSPGRSWHLSLPRRENGNNFLKPRTKAENLAFSPRVFTYSEGGPKRLSSPWPISPPIFDRPRQIFTPRLSRFLVLGSLG